MFVFPVFDMQKLRELSKLGRFLASSLELLSHVYLFICFLVFEGEDLKGGFA